jgi:hypothetical protein
MLTNKEVKMVEATQAVEVQVITPEQRRERALAQSAAAAYELAGDERALRAIYAGRYPEWQYGRHSQAQ